MTQPKIPRRRIPRPRMRIQLCVTLSTIAHARIASLATQRQVTRSQVVEELVGAVDYREMFSMFGTPGMTVSKIVIATGQPPAIVRAVFEEYKEGLAELGSRPTAPSPTPAPLAVVPSPKKAPAKSA